MLIDEPLLSLASVRSRRPATAADPPRVVRAARRQRIGTASSVVTTTTSGCGRGPSAIIGTGHPRLRVRIDHQCQAVADGPGASIRRRLRSETWLTASDQRPLEADRAMLWTALDEYGNRRRAGSNRSVTESPSARPAARPPDGEASAALVRCQVLPLDGARRDPEVARSVVGNGVREHRGAPSVEGSRTGWPRSSTARCSSSGTATAGSNLRRLVACTSSPFTPTAPITIDRGDSRTTPRWLRAAHRPSRDPRRSGEDVTRRNSGRLPGVPGRPASRHSSDDPSGSGPRLSLRAPSTAISQPEASSARRTLSSAEKTRLTRDRATALTPQRRRCRGRDPPPSASGAPTGARLIR